MLDLAPTPFDDPGIQENHRLRVRNQQLEKLMTLIAPYIAVNDNGYYRVKRTPLFFRDEDVEIFKEAL